ncbi:MAG: hypothetical protein KGJ86_08435 [Chloroflexota bacterium]|nr:hypothetical protein [Chloroflexota bacterium]
MNSGSGLTAAAGGESNGAAVTYRAEHVGSLLRPPELLDARSAVSRGERSAEQLRDIENRAIATILETQRAIGMDVVSDGEFRRASWLTKLQEAVEGFIPQRLQRVWKGGEGPQEVSVQTVGAKLRPKNRIYADEAAYLKTHARGPFKITIPGPMLYTLLGFRPGLTDRFYASRAELLGEMTAILASEISSLVEEGVTYVQIDDTSYSYFISDERREYCRSLGVDPDEAFEQAIEADNVCFRAAKKPGVTTALHICRGNNRGRWHSAGGYDPVAEMVFGSIAVDRLLLEYDSERAGTFEPLRFVPANKVVVLGLVSTKVRELEARDELLRRIDEASRYVPIERLAISPQCGFATISEGHPLTHDDQWRKLQLVVDVARRVWPR